MTAFQTDSRGEEGTGAFVPDGYVDIRRDWERWLREGVLLYDDYGWGRAWKWKRVFSVRGSVE